MEKNMVQPMGLVCPSRDIISGASTAREKLRAALDGLRVHDHLCLIYETIEEQFAAVIPFMRIGLELGEKCVYIADENTAAVVLTAMSREGIDVDSSLKSGALSVISKKEAYLREGYFDPDLMILFLREAVEAAKEEGFTALRATGEMTWALGDEIGVERLLEYEAKLNYFIPENAIIAICQYNRARFSPEIILDIIHTHPLVICGDMVCRNHYYVPPEEFLSLKDASSEVERLLHNIREWEAREEERERLILDLKDALEKIRTLSGLVPICSCCKKIRDDKGYWKNLVEYLSEHTEAEFTHGLCPDCAEIMRKEIEEIKV